MQYILFLLSFSFFKYFKAVLITEDTESLQLHSKIYYVFDELCHISETIVDELIPTIEHRLTVTRKRKQLFYSL